MAQKVRFSYLCWQDLEEERQHDTLPCGCGQGTMEVAVACEGESIAATVAGDDRQLVVALRVRDNADLSEFFLRLSRDCLGKRSVAA
jgi:hypothetical protein